MIVSMRIAAMAAAVAFALALFVPAARAQSPARPGAGDPSERTFTTADRGIAGTPVLADGGGDGNGNGNGNGDGNGDGDGNGGGTGEGSGNGNGSGNVNGSGAGDGSGNAKNNGDGKGNGGENDGEGGSSPRVIVEFVSAIDGVLTWRIRPSTAADLTVWDESAEECQESNGAACGDIARSGHGAFSASGGPGQSFLVTQKYKKTGESVKVTKKVRYALPGQAPVTVVASYELSGAPTLGWPLLTAFVAFGIGGAWVVRRRVVRC